MSFAETRFSRFSFAETRFSRFSFAETRFARFSFAETRFARFSFAETRFARFQTALNEKFYLYGIDYYLSQPLFTLKSEYPQRRVCLRLPHLFHTDSGCVSKGRLKL